MTSKFLAEANAALSALIEENDGGRYALKKPKRSVVICGVSAEKINKSLAEKCMAAIEGLQMDVLPVVNDFFGPTVTCTGLLTGKDILAALQNYCKETGDFDEVILPGNTLKEFEDVFLCGMTLKQLKKKFVFENIKINREGGYGLVEIVAAEG